MPAFCNKCKEKTPDSYPRREFVNNRLICKSFCQICMSKKSEFASWIIAPILPQA